MVRIRRFGIIRTANMVAALYAFIALIFFGFIAVFGVAGLRNWCGQQHLACVHFGTGIVGILLFGLVVIAFYVIVGWIFTAIACAIYNLIAGWVGWWAWRSSSSRRQAAGTPGTAIRRRTVRPAAIRAPGAYPNPGTYPDPAPAPVGGEPATPGAGS